MKTKKYDLPLEQRAKDEVEPLKIFWNQGPYNFLLHRTLNFYHRSKTRALRDEVSSKIGNYLFPITDDLLLSLYEHACKKYQAFCKFKYSNNSGFMKTNSEIKFIETIESVLRDHPEFKGIEIYPSYSHSKDVNKMMKMVVGNHVPDFILFGIKTKGSSGVALEIDGDSHIAKYEKDLLKDNHLQEMKLFTFSIQNDQVRDYNHILKCLKEMYKVPSGALNNQIQQAKRMIWAKTIACNLTLTEMDQYVWDRYGINLYLEKQALEMGKLNKCARNIKKELSF
jgi:very-short-patch-repair endonuclease